MRVSTMKPRPTFARGLIASLLVALASCGGSETSPAPASEKAAAEAPAGEPQDAPQTDRDPRKRKQVAETAVSALPGEAGALRGTVRFEGPPPARKPISMGAVAGCEGHTQSVLTEAAIVAGGKVQNAIVWIRKGLDSAVIPAAPSEPAVLNQKGCLYVPHVMAVRAGQKLLVHNGDPAGHNVNARPKRAKNKSFNNTQPANSADIEVVFQEEEVAVPFGCDIHPWMKSWVAVLGHPYFATTGADGGWNIPGLAPGSYELEVWHETFGRQSVEVTLSATDGALADFTYGPR